MAPLTSPQPALFLDRDGVIVHDTGFLTDPSIVELVPGVAPLIKRMNDSHIPVLVVTNQSGIDRGLLGWADFNAVEARIARLLVAEGAATAATAACPFHPDHTTGYDRTHAHWRKPEAGMILALADSLGIDLAGSCLIGDRLRDIEAAQKAGLAGGFLLADPSGPDSDRYQRELASAAFAFDCGSSIAQADDWLARSVLSRDK